MQNRQISTIIEKLLEIIPASEKALKNELKELHLRTYFLPKENAEKYWDEIGELIAPRDMLEQIAFSGLMLDEILNSVLSWHWKCLEIFTEKTEKEIRDFCSKCILEEEEEE